jgi:hypothetical protein
MANRYKYTPIEKAIKIIEWKDASDFQGQLEWMAKCCDWKNIALYAAHRADLESQTADGLELSHKTSPIARALGRGNPSPSSVCDSAQICPDCGYFVCLHDNGRFVNHGPINSRCPGSKKVFVAP